MAVWLFRGDEGLVDPRRAAVRRWELKEDVEDVDDFRERMIKLGDPSTLTRRSDTYAS